MEADIKIPLEKIVNVNWHNPYERAQKVLEDQGYLIIACHDEYEIGKPIYFSNVSMFGIFESKLQIIGTATKEEVIEQSIKYPTGMLSEEELDYFCFFYKTVAE